MLRSMGDLIRYTNEFTRERIPSAAKDIFLGVKKNKSLESLDLSYNHFGPLLGNFEDLALTFLYAFNVYTFLQGSVFLLLSSGIRV